MNCVGLISCCSLLIITFSTLTLCQHQYGEDLDHVVVRRDTPHPAAAHPLGYVEVASANFKNENCIVKGSYCQCHYCRCEKGQLHCKDDPKKKTGYGKRYCYGSMEGEHCHCDYCKCRHGYGHEGWASCH